MDRKGSLAAEKIAEYIKNLEFHKKALGGCDEEDVFQKIGEICEMYEAVIRRLEEEYNSKSRELIGSMSQIKEYREHTLRKARKEADAALAEAKEEAETLLTEAKKEAETEQKKLDRFRNTCNDQLEKIRKENKEYCDKLRSILSQIEALDYEKS